MLRAFQFQTGLWIYFKHTNTEQTGKECLAVAEAADWSDVEDSDLHHQLLPSQAWKASSCQLHPWFSKTQLEWMGQKELQLIVHQDPAYLCYATFMLCSCQTKDCIVI